MQTNFQLCPKFTKIFSILGKKWNGLIIDVLLIAGPQRFRDLAAKINKCSDRVLVERLKELIKEGLVEKVAVEGCCREQYQLTKRGQDLQAMMTALHEWADKWYTTTDCE